MQEKQQKAITKYKMSHPRTIVANFDGQQKEYKIDQLGLDIIESLEKRIIDMQLIERVRGEARGAC